MVDSHSFPLQVSIFPELSDAGAYSSKQVYSEKDVQDVIGYAAEVRACLFQNAMNAYIENDLHREELTSYS